MEKKSQIAPSEPTPEDNLQLEQNTEPAQDLTHEITQKNLRYTWMVPIMVIMVVGATIYLAVLEKKIEYVYGLATACFGYYFGSLNPPGGTPTKKS